MVCWGQGRRGIGAQIRSGSEGAGQSRAPCDASNPDCLNLLSRLRLEKEVP